MLLDLATGSLTLAALIDSVGAGARPVLARQFRNPFVDGVIGETGRDVHDPAGAAASVHPLLFRQREGFGCVPPPVNPDIHDAGIRRLCEPASRGYLEDEASTFPGMRSRVVYALSPSMSFAEGSTGKTTFPSLLRSGRSGGGSSLWLCDRLRRRSVFPRTSRSSNHEYHLRMSGAGAENLAVTER